MAWVDPPEGEELDETATLVAIDSEEFEAGDELPTDPDETDEDDITDAAEDASIPDIINDDFDAGVTAEDVEPIDEEEPDSDDELPTDPDEADESEDLDETLPANDPDEPSAINDNQATLPCICSVKQGDTVMVAMRNGEPTVIGRAGWGDAIETSIESAAAIAEQAQEVADATNQHFFSDSSGVHVTEAENDATTDHNILINSLGILLRKATNYLVSITSSAIAFYDGLGTAASNVVASFGASLARIGYAGSNHVDVTSSGVSMYNSDGVLRHRVGNSATNWYDSDGSTSIAGISSTTARFGKQAAPHIVVNSNGLHVYGTSDGGTKTALFGSTARIGDSDGTHVLIDSDSLDIAYAATEITHFGYGSGTDSGGGTAIAPYYTIGTRASGSTVGNYSVAEGYNTTASGYASHGEGYDATASGGFSHAEGYGTTASGGMSHAEGYETTASATGSHAEGGSTTASEWYSHAEGYDTTASGRFSHAEGYDTTASEDYSHAQNLGTIAAGDSQTALGQYNVKDTSNTYAVIVGNGTANARSNALTVDWSGNVKAAGNITAANIGTTKDATSSAVSVSNNSAKAIASVTLAAGVWIITAGTSFVANSTGMRAQAIHDKSATMPSIYTPSYIRVQAASGTATALGSSLIVVLASSATYYLNALQTSGGALDVTGEINAVRIK